MDDPRSLAGGAANTPPFPRLLRNEPLAAGEPPAPDPRHEPMSASAPISEGPEEPIESPRSTEPETWGDTDPDDVPLLHGAEHSPAGRRQAARRLAGRAGERIRRRAKGSFSRGFEEVAERLDEAASRIDRLATHQLQGDGARARVGDFAHTTAGWMEDAAGYLRESDLQRVRADLEHQVREKPIQMLFLALGTGWLIGKVMR